LILVGLLIHAVSLGAATIELTGTIRDFQTTHPDMQYRIAFDPGIVEPILGPDGKPVYTTTRAFTTTTHGRDLFDQWYRNVAGVNLSTDFTLQLSNSAANPGIYTYDNQNFFPINGQLFGNQGMANNYYFTYELHSRFTYQGGEVFNFRGDDDVWVFINKRLVIDLGGVHGPADAQVNLNAVATQIGLEVGKTYDLDLFFAERYCCGSSFRIQTSIVLQQPPEEEQGHAVVRYTGDVAGDYHDPATLSAELLDDSKNPPVPIADAVLTLRLGDQSCKAPTDAQGRAACSLTPEMAAGDQPLRVEFPGDFLHAPAEASGTFAVRREQALLTAISVRVGLGGAVRAVLREDGAVGVAGRPVTFRSGALSAAAVTGADGTAAATLALPPGDHSVQAVFDGDGFYAASTAAWTVRVLPRQISILPQPNVAAVESTQGVVAQILDLGAARAGERIGFEVIAGPNSGATGACEPAGCAADGSGRATFRYAGGPVPGPDTVRAYLDVNRNGALDAGEAQATATLHWTSRHATQIRYDGALSGDYHDAARLSAVLVDTEAEPDVPVAGALLSLTSPAGSCAARTDAAGHAVCWITPQVEAGSYELLVDFAGDSGHAPARAAGTFAVTREQTTLTITSPAALATGEAVARAVLREDGSLPIAGRQILFQVGSASFQAVTDAQGVATVNLGLAGGEHELVATFAVDAFYRQATARLARLLVYEPGQFVIWGGNAPALDQALPLGHSYVFWGAQWADQVHAGDFSANPSFKGYADEVSPDLREWRTRPGDASQPPPTVPAYLGILIATHIQKDGDTERGNIAGIGVMRVTDPAAYRADPGHPASGILLAILPPDGGAGSAGTPPAAPTAVTAVVGEGFAEVRWTPPMATGSGPITGYTVSVTPSGLQIAVPAGETSRIVSSLALGTSYSFAVAATNAAGTGPASEPSPVVTSLTVPGAPRTVAAVAGDGSATVTWSAPESDGGSPVLFYRIEPLPAGAPVTVPGGTFSALIPGLENGTAYTFIVRAQNAVGVGPESAPSASVLPVTIPAAPLAVVADAGDRQATVYWTAAAGGGSALASYRVVASPGGTVVTVPSDRVFAVLSGLDNGVAYRFSVVATSGAGESPASIPSVEVIPFGRPDAALAVQGTRGNGTALVTWTAPAADGGRPITGYTIVAAPGDLTSAVPAGGTSRLITGLANGTSYTFRVEAVNEAGAGAPSTASAAVTPATVPDKPTAVQAVAGGGQATVSWTPPGTDGGSPITGYNVVSHPGLQQVSVAAGVTTATVGGLTNGTEYVFIVRAANALGNGPESQPSAPVTPAVVAGAPTNVLATIAGVATASVSWSAPVSNGGAPITGYTVTSSPGGLTVSAAGSAVSAAVSGLTLGTTYTFTVTATNRVGTGPASAPSNAVTAATTPGAPTAVTAVDGNASATVTWTPLASTGFSPISSYTVTSSPGGVTTTVNGATTSAVVNGLTNGTQYTFTVRAANAVGSGPSSAPSNPVTPATVPGAPTTVVAAVAGDASIRVTWSPPASNGGAPITGYTVTSTPGGLTASVDGATTSATVTGLIVGTTYTFRVTATNRKGTGAASAPSNAVTAAGAPGAPTNVTAVDGNTAATVTWTPPASNGSSPITAYEVVSSPGGINASVGAGVTTATVSGLQNGTAYTFSVRAVNAIGAGPFSAASNPVTPATVPGAPAGVTAALGGNASAAVSWAPPATDGGASITGYVVTSTPGGFIATVNGTATTARVTGLTVGTTYTFTVAAVNRKGTGPSSAASNALTAAAVPDAPTGASATPGDASAVVTWTPPADGGSTPIVSSTVTTYPGGATTTVPGTATSATVTGLTNGTSYTFTVRATNAAGTGPESAPTAPVTPHEAGAVVLAGLVLSPSDVTGGAPSSGIVSLTGPAPAGGVAVTLASANPAAGVPASVTVPEGAIGTTFPIVTQAVTAITDVTISATLDATTRTAVLRLHPVPPGTPPTAEIQTPADGMEVTSPTQIIGTAIASGFREYVLEIAPAGESVFTTIATGNSPVISGALGRLDPSQLLNGIYTLRLNATDAAGQTSTDSMTVNVTGNLKLGTFALSFADVKVPMTGMPIEIDRSYDTRDKRSGDFGIGWSLGLRNARLQKSVDLGDAWQMTSSGGGFPSYCLQPRRPHLVTITFPNGRIYKFQATTSPSCQQLVPLEFTSVVYQQVASMPGTQGASLVAIGAGDVQIVGAIPGDVQLIDLDTVDVYNPTLYRLTTAEGYQYTIEQSFGATEIIDPNGNTLTINSGGVIHSSGKSVVFTRDSAGRITKITDPAGGILRYAYDAAGDLVTFTDRDNHVTTFTYDPSHHMLTMTDPNGKEVISAGYDSDGRLVSQANAEGNSANFTNDIDGRSEIITDASGNSTSVTFDDSGNILTETDATGGVTTYTYDARGNRLTRTDAKGQTTTYTYDAQDRLLTATDPLGNVSSMSYDTHGNPLTVSDPRGGVTVNTFDTKNNLLSTTDAAGKTTTYSYDALGRRTSVTTPAGCTTTYEHDTAGNVTKITDGLGHSTMYTFDASGNRLTETKTRTVNGVSENLVTTWTYDMSGHLLTTTYPDGAIERNEYDGAGQQTKKIDLLGHVTRYEYDAAGHLLRTIHPDATVESITYDANGRIQTKTDRDGRTTTLGYNGAGRPNRTTFGDGSFKAVVYDLAGRVTSTSNERGATTVTEYDGAGRISKEIDALGHSTTFTYDRAGYKLTATDANSHTTTYEYDALNRQTKEIYADGTFKQLVYDADGRKIQEIDPAGAATSFEYDCAGRLTKVTDPTGGVTTYGYDEVGNRISQTDAESHTTTFAYDKRGRLVKKTLPLGQETTYIYDLDGNVTSTADANGAVTTLTYDVEHRLASRSTPDGTVDYTYTAAGLRNTVVDARGTTTYAYDDRGRVANITEPDGRAVSYTYDAAGNRLTVATPLGVTSYAYDLADRLTQVTSAEGVTTYGYDLVGNRVLLTNANGTSAVYTYDSRNRLTDLINKRADGSVITEHHYTLGAAGNRLRVTESGGRVVDYGYDGVYRLTSEVAVDSAGTSTTTYMYDRAGNRLTKTENGVTTDSVYDANDRLLTEGATTYAYDANGNMTSRVDGSGQTLYEYDSLNRLVRITAPSGVTQYVYDADGNRVQKSSGGTVFNYVLDRGARNTTVLGETDGAGAVRAAYTYGDDLLAMRRGGVTSFYHFDGQLSTRALTNALGQTTDQYTFSAFGTLVRKQGTTENEFLYTGQQYDANAGFYYLRARYYDPATGRFTSSDTFDGNPFEPMTLHKYVYANDNPANMVDPSGHEGTLAELNATVTFNNILTYYWPTFFKLANVAVVDVFYYYGFNQRNGAIDLIATGRLGPNGLRRALDMYERGNLIIELGSKAVTMADKSIDVIAGVVGLAHVGLGIYELIEAFENVPRYSSAVPVSRDVVATLYPLQESGANLFTRSLGYRASSIHELFHEWRDLSDQFAKGIKAVLEIIHGGLHVDEGIHELHEMTTDDVTD
jgi:fibro-slime domain-containing protein/RHS repeat-associated protein